MEDFIFACQEGSEYCNPESALAQCILDNTGDCNAIYDCIVALFGG